MSEFDQPISAEMAAELAALDRLISGRPDGTESPELAGLTELLTVARPQPRPEFLAALDAKAEVRFGTRETAGQQKPAPSRKLDWSRWWIWVRNGALVAAIGASFAAVVLIVSSPNEDQALSTVAGALSASSGATSSTSSGALQASSSAGASTHQSSKPAGKPQQLRSSSGTSGSLSGGTSTSSSGFGALNGTATRSTAATDANAALTLKVAANQVAPTLAELGRIVKAHGGHVVKQRRSSSPLTYHLQISVAANRLSPLISALEHVAGVKVLGRQTPTRPAQGSRTVQLVLVLTST